MSVIAFSSTIGPIPVNCLISERHSTELEITRNPIETGAEVNDHAYVKPKQVVLDIADANAAATYNALIRFQEARVPFYLVTGLTVYEDMLIQAIDATRDAAFSKVLKATVTCRQVIIAGTASTGGGGAEPKGLPGGKKSLGSARPSKETATNAVTSNRVASSVQTGDNLGKAVEPAKTQSILSRVFQ